MNIDFSKSDQKSFEKIYDNLKKQNEQQQTSGSSQQKGGTNQ
jgi:hypothetical protein